MIDDELLVDLYEAGELFAHGDKSGMERLLPHIKNGELYDDIPLLFYVADNTETLDFLEENGVNFLQKSCLGGGNLLHRTSSESDDHVFEWVLSWYKNKNIIDTPDDNGITVLSSLLKIGPIERAKRLIDSGASIYSVADNGLTPARQAVYHIGEEKHAIEGLETLRMHGLTLSEDESQYLVNMAKRINRPNLAKWIETHLRS